MILQRAHALVAVPWMAPEVLLLAIFLALEVACL